MSAGRLILFSTEIGWFALLHRNHLICRLRIGCENRQQAMASEEFTGLAPRTPDDLEKHWVQLFQRYASGEDVAISNLPIDETQMTPFQRSVTDACRGISRGQVLTYGQLADRAGSPGSSRAVGTIMAKNPTPLIVPCHRVVSSRGLGGFSAGSGLELKRRLLELEGAISPSLF